MSSWTDLPVISYYREFLRAATKIRPQVVLDTIKAGEALEVREGVKVPIKSRCERCDYISSQPVCKDSVWEISTPF